MVHRASSHAGSLRLSRERVSLGTVLSTLLWVSGIGAVVLLVPFLGAAYDGGLDSRSLVTTASSSPAEPGRMDVATHRE